MNVCTVTRCSSFNYSHYENYQLQSKLKKRLDEQNNSTKVHNNIRMLTRSLLTGASRTDCRTCETETETETRDYRTCELRYMHHQPVPCRTSPTSVITALMSYIADNISGYMFTATVLLEYCSPLMSACIIS